MTEAQQLYETIVEEFVQNDNAVNGKMMNAPALKAKGKVFAFFYNETMTFKLGKDFDPEAYGLQSWTYLSPFKHKLPMKAWFAIPFPQSDTWKSLTQLALDKL